MVDKKQADLKATGPAISGFTLDANAVMAMEAGELGRLAPQFYNDVALGVQPFLRPRAILMAPEDVSYTMPDVTAVWFETFTGAEPTLNFPDFVKGVSCAALGVELDDVELVKGTIRMLAERVMVGGSLPPLDIRFGPAVQQCYTTILANGEPISWRALMAFTLGAFWLLGFVVNPMKKIRKRSSLDFVREFVEYYAQLGYLPT